MRMCRRAPRAATPRIKSGGQSLRAFAVLAVLPELGIWAPEITIILVRGLVSPGTPSARGRPPSAADRGDRKSTRLNSSHGYISYAVFCLKKKKKKKQQNYKRRTMCA